MNAPGRLLGGRYEVGELLGYGGMAEVHKGRDLRLGRDVAIKMLRSDLARDHTFQLRFRREAQNAATLNHPGIVAVYDTGEETSPTGESLPYIVMEFVRGQTQTELLAAEQRLQPRRALEIAADICAALEFSHRHGIIHRDVKPGNVMVTPNGQVKVMDFGIARDIASGATTMTQTSAVIGTAQYLSPEQARGEAVDARSDVYATGCVLFELLCGHPPFVGDSPVSVAYQHVREDPRPPSELNPEVTPDIDAVVLKALAKNPANRYQSAAEMRADLLRAASGRPVLATPVMNEAETVLLGAAGGAGEPARVADPDRRRASTWVMVALGALGVLAVIALIIGLVLSNSTRQVQVPSVVGLSPEDAVAAIEAAGLVASEGEGITEGCVQDEGLVERQTPAAGESLDEGETVTYQVCTGPETVIVPDVSELPEERARAELEDLDLRVEVEEASSSLPAGYVVRTDPPAGEEVPVNSQVKLYVSAGDIRTVPNVVGMAAEVARGVLENAGYQVAAETASTPPESAEQVGTVASQSPQPDSELARGETVTIYIYPDGGPLEARLQPGPNPLTVIVDWDNDIYGGVTIDWGDGESEIFNAAEGSYSHTYDAVPREYVIRVTATDHPERTVTIPVSIEP